MKVLLNSARYGAGFLPRAERHTRTFDSESPLLEYVAAGPGAIGYVSKIPRQDQDKVKCLAVVR
jgi:hypothetical protein